MLEWHRDLNVANRRRKALSIQGDRAGVMGLARIRVESPVRRGRNREYGQ